MRLFAVALLLVACDREGSDTQDPAAPELFELHVLHADEQAASLSAGVDGQDLGDLAFGEVVIVEVITGFHEIRIGEQTLQVAVQDRAALATVRTGGDLSQAFQHEAWQATANVSAFPQPDKRLVLQTSMLDLELWPAGAANAIREPGGTTVWSADTTADGASDVQFEFEFAPGLHSVHLLSDSVESPTMLWYDLDQVRLIDAVPAE
ncbi:MAG: hypothetical protein AB8H79_00485 [Myxococcota bacterium]